MTSTKFLKQTKLNAHKTLTFCPGHYTNLLCTFHVANVSINISYLFNYEYSVM